MPLATTVPKLFVALFSVISPAVPAQDDTKFAVPLIVKLPAPLCVIELPEINVRLEPSVVLFLVMAAVFTLALELRAVSAGADGVTGRTLQPSKRHIP